MSEPMPDDPTPDDYQTTAGGLDFERIKDELRFHRRYVESLSTARAADVAPEYTEALSLAGTICLHYTDLGKPGALCQERLAKVFPRVEDLAGQFVRLDEEYADRFYPDIEAIAAAVSGSGGDT